MLTNYELFGITKYILRYKLVLFRQSLYTKHWFMPIFIYNTDSAVSTVPFFDTVASLEQPYWFLSIIQIFRFHAKMKKMITPYIALQKSVKYQTGRGTEPTCQSTAQDTISMIQFTPIAKDNRMYNLNLWCSSSLCFVNLSDRKIAVSSCSFLILNAVIANKVRLTMMISARGA